MQSIGYYDHNDPLSNLFTLGVILALYYVSLIFVFLVIWPIRRKIKEKQCLNKCYDKSVSVLVFDGFVLITIFCYLEMLILGILAY